MEAQYIVKQALDYLKNQAGIKGKWTPGKEEQDGILIFDVKGEKFAFNAEVKKEVRLYQLMPIIERARKQMPFMVVAVKITDEVKEELRNREIAYLETNGNAFIQDRTLFIAIQHAKMQTHKIDKPKVNRAFTKTGLRVIFHLLRQPEAINETYRTIAGATGVALGNIKNILDGLREAGYILAINREKLALKNKKLLLERWITGYRETLKPALLKGQYKMWSKDKIIGLTDQEFGELGIVLGGEPAAERLTNYLQPAMYTLYTDEDEKLLMRKLVLIPTEQEADIKIYGRFWKDGDDEALHTAPPLLVYADLVMTDDPRCIETAGIIYQQFLAHELEGN